MNPLEQLTKRGYTGFVKADSGGQANVYKSFKDGQAYAIKVSPIESTKSGQSFFKLGKDQQVELQIIRNLRHPNCIKVKDIFRTKKRLYIVMDFFPHNTVSSFVRKIGPLCEWHAKCWFPPIARAIKYLHENKVVHRDLKLSNIMLDAYYNPIVTDFGLSSFVTDESALSTTWCGTLSYHPPEIIQEVPYDPFKVDIWCLGIMLFVMLNKKRPFVNRNDKVADRNNKVDDRNEMLVKQLAKDYHFTEDVDRKITHMVKELIESMMEPDAAKRPLIQKVCAHRWFPIILEEANYLANKSVNSE